jgi:hypothetical protein
VAITRREFIEGTAVVGGAAVLASGAGAAGEAMAASLIDPAADPASHHPFADGEQGSPYLLSSHGPHDGFAAGIPGVDGYERMREEIIHFGMSPEDRDRYLWGL